MKRKLLRSIARGNMKRVGISKVNKKFAHLWRNYI